MSLTDAKKRSIIFTDTMNGLLRSLTQGIPIHMPRLHVNGMALWPFILHREAKPPNALWRHERIHLRQQVEMLVIPFYLWYLSEYAVYRLFRKMKHTEAYRALMHEREAYTNDSEPDYLERRKPYAWLRFG